MVIVDFVVQVDKEFIRVKAGNIEIELTIEEALSYLPEFGINLDLDNITNFDSIIDIIRQLEINETNIKLLFQDFLVSYDLVNPNTLYINNELLNVELNAEETLVSNEPLVLTNPLTKYQVDELILAGENVFKIFDQTKSYYKLSGEVVGEFIISGDIKLDIKPDKMNVDIHLIVNDIREGGRVHDVSLISLDGYTYITYNGMKVYAETEAVNKTIKTVLVLMGIENPLIDSVLDVTIDSFENVFAPYLGEGSDIKILDYIESLNVEKGLITGVLNKDSIYNFLVTEDPIVRINQTQDHIQSIELKDIYFSETKRFNLNIELQDEEFELIAPSNLGGYHHLSGIDNLIDRFVKTAELKEYHIQGSFNIRAIGIFNINIDNFNLKVVLDDDLIPSFEVTYTVPLFVGVTHNTTEVSVYLKDGIIYAKRIRAWSLFGGRGTERRTWTQAEFEADLMENIFWLLNTTNLVNNQVRNAIKAAENHVILPENILHSYEHIDNYNYRIKVRGEALNGDPALGIITVNLRANENDYLDFLDIQVNVSGAALDLYGKFYHVNIGQPVNINYPDFNTSW